MYWQMALAFGAVALLFLVMAKLNARPGFAAIVLALCLALTPLFSRHLPMRPGDTRDILTVCLLMAVASLGHALGGGLRPRDDHDHDHDHSHSH